MRFIVVCFADIATDGQSRVERRHRAYQPAPVPHDIPSYLLFYNKALEVVACLTFLAIKFWVGRINANWNRKTWYKKGSSFNYRSDFIISINDIATLLRLTRDMPTPSTNKDHQSSFPARSMPGDSNECI